MIDAWLDLFVLCFMFVCLLVFVCFVICFVCLFDSFVCCLLLVTFCLTIFADMVRQYKSISIYGPC